jgi:hypothetical protein
LIDHLEAPAALNAEQEPEQLLEDEVHAAEKQANRD